MLDLRQVLPFDYILFYFFFLPPIRVFILGHCFIRRVRDEIFFAAILIRTFQNLSLDGDLLIRWHGIGGRTVSKTRESSHKMMLSRPTETTFFPIIPVIFLVIRHKKISCLISVIIFALKSQFSFFFFFKI